MGRLGGGWIRTYSEFSYLDIIDTSGFFFLGGAQAERRHVSAEEVEGPEDQTRADEGVGAACEGIGELVPELDPVAVQPAAFDDGVAVEVRDVVTAEED